MPLRISGWRLLSPAAFIIVLFCWPAASAAQKTDVITLKNGDHITGEVKNLDRGRVEFSTDDIGTIYFEWDKIATVTSKHLFEVITTHGSRYVGSFGTAPPGSLAVTTVIGDITLPMIDVTDIRSIGVTFWNKLDGSFDLGFSYTRSSDVAQLNINTTTVYTKPSFEGRLSGSATLTRTEDEDPDERATLQSSLFWYRGLRRYFGISGGLDTNDSLGLILRTQVGVTGGARWFDSNRAQLWTGAGIAVNNEQRIDTDAQQNIEGVMTLRTAFYTYDRPRTTFDLSFVYYPSLSDFGRQRLQLDTSIKRELWKDVFVSLTLYDTFDNRPPSADSARNDVGVTFSFGWTY